MSKCLKCGKNCCTMFGLAVELVGKQKEMIRTRYGNPNMNMLNLKVNQTCVHLTKEGLCDIYNTPEWPQMCREYYCEKAENES